MRVNGLCLLKRKELKFPLNPKNVKAFTKLIKGFKVFKQETWGDYKSVELRNIVFDKPTARELDVYFRQNYSRARVRSYHTKNYHSKYWGEWRSKTGTKVFKNRELLKSTKDLIKFLDLVKAKDLVFNNFSSYTRQAFCSKNTRITIDSDIIYLNNDFEPITHKVFSKPTAIVKFKFSKKPSKEEIYLTYKLRGWKSEV